MAILDNLPSFILATTLLVMIPGQGVAMVLRQSIVGGPKAALLSSIGNCAGILIWSISSAIGLSAVFTDSETAYSILKWSGVLFLTFIFFFTASKFSQIINKKVISVISRVIAIILVGLSVHYILDGIKTFLG